MKKEASRLVEKALSRSISAKTKEAAREIIRDCPPLLTRIVFVVLWLFVAPCVLIGLALFPGWQIAKLLILAEYTLRVCRREAGRTAHEIYEIVSLIEYRDKQSRK